MDKTVIRMGRDDEIEHIRAEIVQYRRSGKSYYKENGKTMQKKEREEIGYEITGKMDLPSG